MIKKYFCVNGQLVQARQPTTPNEYVISHSLGNENFNYESEQIFDDRARKAMDKFDRRVKEILGGKKIFPPLTRMEHWKRREGKAKGLFPVPEYHKTGEFISGKNET